MKITIVGAGYVGLSNAILLAQQHDVTLLDISPEKVQLVNSKVSPIQDVEISEYLANKPLNLHATIDSTAAYADADYIVVTTNHALSATRPKVPVQQHNPHSELPASIVGLYDKKYPTLAPQSYTPPT